VLTTLLFILPFLVVYTIVAVYAERKISAFMQDRLFVPIFLGFSVLPLSAEWGFGFSLALFFSVSHYLVRCNRDCNCGLGFQQQVQHVGYHALGGTNNFIRSSAQPGSTLCLCIHTIARLTRNFLSAKHSEYGSSSTLWHKRFTRCFACGWLAYVECVSHAGVITSQQGLRPCEAFY
jgi:hypothetical protein